MNEIRKLDYSQTCDDCKNGIHDHMNAVEEKKRDLRRHEFLDAIDCKNPVGEGQCVCPLWQQYVSHFPTEIVEMKEEMTWYCPKEDCSTFPSCTIQQNERPTEKNCKEGLKIRWVAKRWIKYSTPNPDYELWLDEYGDEADRILWEREKKDRGVVE